LVVCQNFGGWGGAIAKGFNDREEKKLPIAKKTEDLFYFVNIFESQIVSTAPPPRYVE